MARSLETLRLPRALLGPRLVLTAPRAAHGPQLTEAIAESLPDLARVFRWAETLERWGDLSDMAERARAAADRFDDAEDPAWFVWTRADPGEDPEAPEPAAALVGEVILGTGDYVRHGAVDFSIWIRSSCHGRGYGEEAGRALFAWCFEHGGIDLIEARVASDNPASRKLMSRLGMVEMGYRQDLVRFVSFRE